MAAPSGRLLPVGDMPGVLRPAAGAGEPQGKPPLVPEPPVAPVPAAPPPPFVADRLPSTASVAAKAPPPDRRCWFIVKLDNAPPALKHQLARRGWVQCDADDAEFHLHWKNSRFLPSDYASVSANVRVNHIPKSMAITKKDTLLRNLRQFRNVYGSVYNFFPEGFLLPSEYTKFLKAFAASPDDDNTWICKPVDLSRGRKIYLLDDMGDLKFDQATIIQRYISNPLCIGGYKLDLRLYVLVTSVFPLRAYLYNDGLVRFGTEKYEMADITNLYAHLTNSSINKFAPEFSRDKDVIGAGCKWSLEQLWRVLRRAPDEHGIRLSDKQNDRLWKRIVALVNCTLLILAANCPKNSNGFELFGFDVLLDKALKPWIVEVNSSPALTVECQTDVDVKVPLMGDTIDALMQDAHDARRQPPRTSLKRSASLRAAPRQRGAKAAPRRGSSSSRLTAGSESGTPPGTLPALPSATGAPAPPRRRASSATRRAGGPFGGGHAPGYGRFRRVFPFNSATERLSTDMCRGLAEGVEPVLPKDALRNIVAEIRGTLRGSKPTGVVHTATK